MSFALNRDLHQGILIYRLEGLLDLASINILDQIKLDVEAEKLRGGAKGVILNCHNLQVNSKGVGAIYMLKAELPVPLHLVNVPGRLIQTLKMFGMKDQFVITTSIEESIRDLLKKK